MREWTVGGAIIENEAGLCLVRNRRRDGRDDWSPPGGVIEPGEPVLGGLTREVAEETGLIVTEWAGPIYEVRIEAPEMGWNLTVEVHRAVAFEGELLIADPDGIVVEAGFVHRDDCHQHLSSVEVWVREPVTEWLAEPWTQTRRFEYLVTGSQRSTMSVARR